MNEVFSKEQTLMNEDLELCKKCGGKCCQQYPCHYSPDDFVDLSYDGLKAEIEKGYISIDWWEGDADSTLNEFDKTYFLRVKTAWGCVTDPSWGGQCILWDKENGCPLDFEHRPKGGRMLIPDLSDCKQAYLKLQCALDWRSYYPVLHKLYINFYDYDPMESINRLKSYLDEVK